MTAQGRISKTAIPAASTTSASQLIIPELFGIGMFLLKN